MKKRISKRDGCIRAARCIMAGTVFFLLMPLNAHAGTFSGKRARAYINDLQKKLAKAEYYAVALERRNDEPASGNRFDAVIFSRLGRTFRVIRRLDGDHALILNAASGENAARVTPDNFAHYARLIKDNAMQPEVVLDKDGSELAIVYCGLKPCRVITHMSGDRQLNVEVRKYLLQPERDELFPLVIEPEL